MSRGRGTRGVPRRRTGAPAVAVAEPADEPAVLTPLPAQPTTTDHTDHAGETVLNYELRDAGTLYDYWQLHLTTQAAGEQAKTAAKQARTEEAQRLTHLQGLQRQMEELSQEILAAQHAVAESGQRAQELEADADCLARRAQDHADTTERLRMHNNLPHPGGANAGPSSLRPEEALDQTASMPLSQVRA